MPPAKTKSEHKRNGTFRKDRHLDKTQQGHDSTRPKKPVDLTQDQSDCWDSLVCNLETIVCSKDEPSLRAAVDLWQVWVDYRSEDDPQRFYKGLAALKQFNVIAAKFGVTPIDRMKLPTSKGEESHGILKLLQMRDGPTCRVSTR